MQDLTTFKNVLSDTYFLEFWKKGTRNDLRGWTELRGLKIDRLDSHAFVLNFGGNIIQCSYEPAKARLLVTPDSDRKSFVAMSNILQLNIEGYKRSFQTDSLKSLIIEFLEANMSDFFTIWKQGEAVKLSIQCLADSGNLQNAIILAALLTVYFICIERNAPFLSDLKLWFPVIVVGFYIAEKNAVQWMADPNPEESDLQFGGRPAIKMLLFLEGSGNRFALFKLGGSGLAVEDLHTLKTVALEATSTARENLAKLLSSNQIGFSKLC